MINTLTLPGEGGERVNLVIIKNTLKIKGSKFYKVNDQVRKIELAWLELAWIELN